MRNEARSPVCLPRLPKYAFWKRVPPLRLGSCQPHHNIPTCHQVDGLTCSCWDHLVLVLHVVICSFTIHIHICFTAKSNLTYPNYLSFTQIQDNIIIIFFFFLEIGFLELRGCLGFEDERFWSSGNQRLCYGSGGRRDIRGESRRNPAFLLAHRIT